MNRFVLLNRLLAVMSLLLALHILPHNRADAQGISTGPLPSQSATRSRYFLGLTADSNALVSRIKITGLQRQPDGKFLTQLVALDSEGNYISSSTVVSKVKTSILCRGQSPVSFECEIGSNSSSPKAASSAAYIAIDNSLLSGTTARDVILSLKGALSGASSSDSIGIGIYNQTLTTLQRVGPLQRSIENVSLDDIPTPSGVSALYSILAATARELPSSGSVRSVVIVTSTGDNASAVTSTKDVVRQMLEAGIKVHVIRIGLDLATQPLRYVSSATGGTLYTMKEGDAGNVGDVVREILYAERWNSTLAMPGGIEDVVECNSRWLRIELPADSMQIAVVDSILLPHSPLDITTSPSVVALFDDETDNGLQQYYPLLSSIAERLSENITMHINLTGHVDQTMVQDADARALERAQNVKGFLMANGVLERQISIRSDGGRRPLFYFSDDNTRKQMNNRVEATISWTDNRPHTIRVDQVASEDEAQMQIPIWGGRGYRAFFESVISNGQSAYSVVLWGFRSKELADAAAAKVKKQYKLRFAVVE